MLDNCEKMVVIPTTTNNQWPQIGDQAQKISSMGSCGRCTTAAMEKPSAQAELQQQQSLKCPRCDSTNTKFCYYNNYSLSQPRHFCKSCKRYWTRGGTLRNVPVGGGCRKNKRVKRQTPSASDHTPSSSSSSPSAANSNLPSQPHMDNHVSPLFYGLPGNSNSDMNLPFPRFSSGYNDHLSALGLGFSSGYASSNDSLFSNYSSLFGNSIFGGSSTAISSLLSPSSTNLQQHKFMNGGLKDDDVVGAGTFQGLEPLEDAVKADEERPNQIMEHGSLFDYYSSPYYWNDQTNNVGPSVTSMIE